MPDHTRSPHSAFLLRLEPSEREYLAATARQMGISETQLLRMLIRNMYRLLQETCIVHSN